MIRTLALVAVLAAAAAACAPPPAQVSGIVQREPCTEGANPAIDPTACVRWIGRHPSFGYPAGTQWVGPYSTYLADLDPVPR